MPTGKSIFAMIEEMGIDHERFKKVMEHKEPWGKFVHAFEYLTVLAVVEQAWDNQIKENEL